MAKDPNFGHAPNEDGVCGQCGLEMEYLLAAKANCTQSPAAEEVAAEAEEAAAEEPAADADDTEG